METRRVLGKDPAIHSKFFCSHGSNVTPEKIKRSLELWKTYGHSGCINHAVATDGKLT